MNLALVHCAKEWRAQRGLLTAYLLLAFGCLLLGLCLAPERGRFDEALGVHVLSWFVAIGVIGVALFVAPGLVRLEFGQKDDQFVRRLPGALWPSFLGKLLFLVLATAALPLLGLLVGEWFAMARGLSWPGLFRHTFDGEVYLDWPGVVVGCGAALLLSPWIFAVGTWLPGGRMAVGGTLLLMLVLGCAVAAGLAFSPGIGRSLAWQHWLWFVPLAGMAVALVSWHRGRRGGGAPRSARLGLVAMVGTLAPPALWFLDCSWDYHHPDLQQLVKLHVGGLSPDGRFVLASGAAHEEHASVGLRIDLSTGAVEQVAGIHTGFDAELLQPWRFPPPGHRRYWQAYDGGSGTPRRTVFDLVTGQWTPIGFDVERREPRLPAELRAELAAEVRRTTPLRAPGGRRAWVLYGELCVEQADGTVSRRPWLRDWGTSLRAAGHGCCVFGKQEGFYDLCGQRLLPLPAGRPGAAFLVRGVLVFVPKGKGFGEWNQQDVGAPARECAALRDCHVLGLYDDDRLLCSKLLRRSSEPGRLFLYRPADGGITELAVPDDLPCSSVAAAEARLGQGSLLGRDEAGRVWLRGSGNGREAFATIDPATLAVTVHLLHSRRGPHWLELLGWPDAHSVLVREDAQLLRIELDSGRRSVLFPRR